MLKIFLRALNAPALLLLAAVAVGLQTSLFAGWPLSYFEPDALVWIVVWMALRREFTEGGVVTLVLAEIAELHSAAPRGTFFVLYMLSYLGVRLAARVLVLPGMHALVMVTVAVCVFTRLAIAGLLEALGADPSWLSTLLGLVPGAIVEGALGVWAFRGLEAFDTLTHRSLRAEREEGTDAILDGDGI
jgi:hypothetical protein